MNLYCLTKLQAILPICNIVRKLATCDGYVDLHTSICEKEFAWYKSKHNVMLIDVKNDVEIFAIIDENDFVIMHNVYLDEKVEGEIKIW